MASRIGVDGSFIRKKEGQTHKVKKRAKSAVRPENWGTDAIVLPLPTTDFIRWLFYDPAYPGLVRTT
jgi:hypothetical protein